jgi:hypothetical protein
MSPPTQTDKPADLPYDAQVATAMNRVLAAEQTARSAIAECEQQMQASLEHARQQRRTILERARARITALHLRLFAGAGPCWRAGTARFAATGHRADSLARYGA